MSQTDFKHITVSAPDDDDVVVWAGQKSAESPEGDLSELDTSAQPAVGVLSEEPIEPVDEAPKPSARPENAQPRTAIRPPEARRGEYRPTTLEDLEREPMPKIQRIVIIAAVVCIIGAIVYCLLKMG